MALNLDFSGEALLLAHDQKAACEYLRKYPSRLELFVRELPAWHKGRNWKLLRMDLPDIDHRITLFQELVPGTLNDGNPVWGMLAIEAAYEPPVFFETFACFCAFMLEAMLAL